MKNESPQVTELATGAVAAVRDCADMMQTQAESLMRSLPDVPMDGTLRAKALELSTTLKDASNRVMFELALLQSERTEGKAGAAATLLRLSGLDAAMMAVVAGATDLVDRLETAAERDEQHELAFVLVIESVGILLQELERAKAATGALAGAISS